MEDEMFATSPTAPALSAEQMKEAALYAEQQARARRRRRNNGTHSRDHSHTLKVNHYRHGEKVYGRLERDRLLRETQEEELIRDYLNGFGWHVDSDPVSDLENYADEVDIEGEIEGEYLPWEDLNLVMHLFEQAIKSVNVLDDEQVSLEVELMRAGLKEAVYAITAGIKVMADIIFPEDILRLLFGKAGYQYFQQLENAWILYEVAANLYALYNKPELIQNYPGLAQNHDVNCA